jgi:hypothetical protein
MNDYNPLLCPYALWSTKSIKDVLLTKSKYWEGEEKEMGGERSEGRKEQVGIS